MSDLLDDYIDLREFAADVKRHPRSVYRWIVVYGLPYARVGSRTMIHLPSARRWLESRILKTRRVRQNGRRTRRAAR
jgi:hypothetical protein